MGDESQVSIKITAENQTTQAVSQVEDSFKDLRKWFDDQVHVTEGMTDALKKNVTEVKEQAAANQKAADATKAHATRMREMASSVNDAVEAVTGFNIKQLAMGGAIALVAGEAKKAISEYSAYVEQVHKISMATGMASTEVSKLIETFDDFNVDQAAVEQAMKMALQNGFTPTIDNLAKLSDKYKALQDPTERAAMLQEIFGRSWQEVIPLLEQGGKKIKEVADAQTGAIIVTREAIVQNQIYIKTVKDFDDAWKNVRYTFANIVTGPLADIIKGLQLAAEEYDKSKNFWDKLAPVAAFREVDRVIRGVESAYHQRMVTTREMLDQMDAEEKKNASIVSSVQKVNTVNERYVSLAEQRAIQGAKSIDINKALAASFEEQRAAAQDVIQATQDLQKAQENWAKGAGNDAASALKEGWMSAAKYKEGLGAIDEVMGTHMKQQQEYKDAMSKIAAEYRRTGDVDTYKQKLGELKDQYMPLDESILKAKDSLDKFRDVWDNLENKTLVLRVQVDQALDVAGQYGKSKSPGSGSSGKYGGESDGATGLDFIVPAGYPNDSYRVNVQSGERVTVSPAGQAQSGNTIVNNFAAGSLVVSGVSDPDAAAEMIFRKFTKKMKTAMNSGSIYRGI